VGEQILRVTTRWKSRLREKKNVDLLFS
jgi:hypothetical protein